MSKQPQTPHSLPRHDGMTVPDGYFGDFARRMAQSLPERPELSAPAPAPRNTWQRVRPYVYMAAMFAGVWCMLKMFAIMSGSATLPLDTNPVMAEALGNDAFVNQFIIDDLSQWDLYDEMMEDGVEPTAFTDSLAIFTETE